MNYRPWGKVDWILSLASKKNWCFIGTIGTEERSLCAWKLLRNSGVLDAEFFFQVNDEYSEKYDAQSKQALAARYQDFSNNGGDQTDIDELELMSELFIIQRLLNKVENQKTSVVLDITSMPKRFFFPILRKLVQDNDVKNLLLTYSSPREYTDGMLYEDIDSWRNLPGFGGASSNAENLIISIGFLVESLTRYLSDNPDHGQIKMLIPFPAPLSVLKRTWESVSNMERDQDGARFEKYRIDTLDMSTAFNYIEQLTSNSQNSTAFAPFGPKPISVAMCLYAMQTDSAVYYPQPTVYHPEYSLGIRNDDPNSAVTAYWVKYEGENLYEIAS